VIYAYLDFKPDEEAKCHARISAIKGLTFATGVELCVAIPSTNGK